LKKNDNFRQNVVHDRRRQHVYLFAMTRLYVEHAGLVTAHDPRCLDA